MMDQSAVKIEKIMDLVISLNEDLATQRTYINGLEEKNTILNTIKDVNYYMGNSLELNEMIRNIIDVVLGVLGVTACSICINKDSGWEITEESILGKDNKIITPELINDVDEAIENSKGEFLVKDLSKNPIFGLKNGAFIAISIKRNKTKYGLIAIYYNAVETFSDTKLEFFRLMSGQLGVHFENAFLFEKVSIFSITDGLTGLYNRAHLNEVVSAENFCESKNLGIIMADLDNFKGVNDNYGHLFGDSVLRYVSKLFKEVALKYKASCFRYGGEEFLMIFYSTNKTDICSAAEEIRNRFSQENFNVGEKTDSFTISLGVSKMDDSSKLTDVFKLINLADDGLYVAKNNGKNKYIFLDGNLDLYLKARHVVAKMVSKYKRYKQQFMIVKISIDIDELCGVNEYNTIMEAVAKSFREYDMVYYNYVGGVLIITENIIGLDVIKKHLGSIEKYKVESMVYNDQTIDIKEFFELDKRIN